ncbi:MAG TPA: tetratricopeptide repeat protein [bacterium]
MAKNFNMRATFCRIVVQAVQISVILMSICSLAEVAAAAEIEALYIRANEYYQNGDYAGAIPEYQRILALGYESWEVYYNLGNAYYKDGDVARAILNYERAKKLDPKNDDVNFNLELANLSVVDRIPQLPQFALFGWITSLSALMSLKWLGIFTCLAYVLFVAVIGSRILFRSTAGTGVMKALAIGLCGSLIVLSGLLLLRIYENESVSEAIVVAERVDVTSAPAESGTELFMLHQGVKVQLMDRSGQWLKIRLADGKVGWLGADNIERI